MHSPPSVAAPYALLQSNQLSRNGFYTYHPFAFLTLLGITLGNYRDNSSNYQKYQIETLQGKATHALASEIASLRSSVFAEYPYLYEATIQQESQYFQTYMDKPSALCVTIKDHGSVVGMALGMSLEDHDNEYKQPFLEKPFNLPQIFYLGDLILLSQYRGKGLGKTLYQKFEDQVQEKNYQYIAFCEIQRGPDDPKKPPHYRSLDTFWKDLGYNSLSPMKVSSSWKEIGGEDAVEHDLVFSIKELSK